MGQDKIVSDLKDGFDIDFSRTVQLEMMKQPPGRICKLRRRQQNLEDKLLSALEEAGNVSNGLATHLKNYHDGDIGAARPLQRLMADAQSWHPDSLTGLSIADNNIVAETEAKFCRLWRTLAPELAFTQWPATFTQAQKCWPTNPPLESFRVFAQLISETWSSALAGLKGKCCKSEFQAWVKVKSYQVNAVLQLLPCCKSFIGLPKSVLAIVSLFVDASPFEVKAVDVPAAEVQPAVVDCDKFQRASSIVAIAISGRRRLIVVKTTDVVPDSRAIARSLEGDKRFSRGQRWYIARAYHRYERIRMQTNMSEAMGGMLNNSWNPTAGYSTGSLISHLMLRSAGFTGVDAADEVVVRTACRH